MPRIKPLKNDAETPEIKAAYARHILQYNSRITNMKATLGHSLIAFKAYMEWYPLYEEVKNVLGPRLSSLFAWAISEASDCPLCSTYFRKIIIESGEDPDSLQLHPNEQQIVSFGANIAQHMGFIPDDIYLPIKERFTEKQIITLTAFAGIMIATNIFNNVVHTDIDEYLFPFTKK